MQGCARLLVRPYGIDEVRRCDQKIEISIPQRRLRFQEILPHSEHSRLVLQQWIDIPTDCHESLEHQGFWNSNVRQNPSPSF